jgi:hypothetical protein
LTDLVRVGRTADELVRVEPSARTFRNCVQQLDRDRGARTGSLTSAECAELAHSAARIGA